MSADFLHPVIRDVFAVHFPVASAPGACHCGGTGRVCDHPCNRCTKEPTMIEDTKATTQDRIAALRAEVERRRVLMDAATRRWNAALADLAEAQGADEDEIAWYRCLAAGESDKAHTHWARHMARMHLAQGTTPGDHCHDEILAAMAVLVAEARRAESGESDAGRGA